MKPNDTNKKQAGKKVLYPDLSYRVMEAVFEVHNHLGPGFTENVYERALIVELDSRVLFMKCKNKLRSCTKDQI